MTAATDGPGEPTLTEDLLLLLFQPASGVIAGENILYYVLGGAVVADLAMQERVTTTPGRLGGTTVHARADRAPSDEILRSAWEYVAARPVGVQTMLAAIGPGLRAPVLARLVDRGDIVSRRRTMLGFIPVSAMAEGATGRRVDLIARVRGVLVDGVDPEPRVAALAGLLWASGTLPQFDPEIPWSSAVITRAEQLQRGNWGATAAARAVARTVAATISSTAAVVTAIAPRG